MENIISALQLELGGLSQLQENILRECKNPHDRMLAQLYIKLKAEAIASRYAELMEIQKQLESDPVLRQYERSIDIF